MKRLCREVLALTCVMTALTACGGDTKTIIIVADGGGDSGTGRDPLDAGHCISDNECNDGRFCNGAELCRPGEPGADEVGCMPARQVPECDDGVACTVDSCSETLNRCDYRAPDADGDGHPTRDCQDTSGDALGDDCDDADDKRFPGHVEVCDIEGHDEDCDGDTFGERDRDGDGELDALCCNGEGADEVCGTDCNDLSIAQRSAQPEFCDGVDNDCDGTPDNDTREVRWYLDNDHDHFGAISDNGVLNCDPIVGASLLNTDCNDSDASRHPAQIELCDFIDNNCNGVADEPFYCNQNGGVIIPDGGMSGDGGTGGAGGTGGTGGAGGTGGVSGMGGTGGTGGTGGMGGTGGTSGVGGSTAGCEPGFSNCDLLAGCETNITTDSDCGGCDIACSNVGAVTSCDEDELVCRLDACATGFADCDENVGTGCETQVNTTSADHCGRCDRACDGAACAAGRCAAVTLLNPSGSSNFCGTHLLSDKIATITCWGNYSEVRYSGLTIPTAPELLGTLVTEYPSVNVAAVRGITSDDTYLYWGVTGMPSVVYRKRRDNTGIVTEAFTSGSNEAFGGLTYNDGQMFWLSNSGAAGTDTIKRRVYPGAGPDITLVNGINEYFMVAFTDTRAVWVDKISNTDFRLRMAPLTQTSPVAATDIAMGAGEIRIAVDDTHVYWVTNLAAPNGALRRFELNNPSAVVETVALSLANPDSITVDATYAYFSTSNTVYRVRKDITAAPQAIATISALTGFIGNDASYIYVVTGAGPSMNVARVTK